MIKLLLALSLLAGGDDVGFEMMVWAPGELPGDKAYCESGYYTFTRRESAIPWTARCQNEPTIQHHCDGFYNPVLLRIDCGGPIVTDFRPNIFGDGFEAGEAISIGPGGEQ